MSNFDAQKNERRMEWLRRNAQVVNVRAEQEHSSDVWQKAVRNPETPVKRAKGQGHLAVGSMTGETPTDFDGEDVQFYHLFMARHGGEFQEATFVASCTCPAWRHDETRPCKHICRAVQYDELETSVITKSGSLVRDVREADDGGERSTGATTILDDDSGDETSGVDDVESQMRICPTHRRARHVRDGHGGWMCLECRPDDD
ncbi:MAG: SWIM zinc finger family protein, partial [Halobaculum sp.]